MPHISKLSLALLAGLVAAATGAGCERRVYFAPVSHDVGPGPNLLDQARYVLAAAKGEAATATVAAQGLLGKKNAKPDEQADAITIILTIRNRLADSVAAAVKNCYLLDDEDTKIEAPQVYSREGLAGDNWVVGPKQTARAILTFRLPPDIYLKKIGSFRLFWSAKVANAQPESFQTKFIRTAEPQVYYAEPYPPYYYDYGGYPYGGYMYGGYPYDGGYGYPYPYGDGFYFGGGGFRRGEGEREHHGH